MPGSTVALLCLYFYHKDRYWYESLDTVPGIHPMATDIFLAGDFNNWFYIANEFKRGYEGSYYYVRSNGQLDTDWSYWITKTNELLPAANYIFDANGVTTNIGHPNQRACFPQPALFHA